MDHLAFALSWAVEHLLMAIDWLLGYDPHRRY
jgi:hypothetical protein